MKKLGPLFAFLIAAAPAVTLAQDANFDRISLRFGQDGKTVDVTVTKSGKAVFVYPDHVVKTKLSSDQMSQLEGSVKRLFLGGSPATDLGVPPGKEGFELNMTAANGTRWVAKGPVDVLRGGPLPPVYHVLRDIQDFGTRADAPAPAADVKALPAPPELKALPAPPELKALPAPPALKALPAPPELKLLPAPAASPVRELVFTANGRKVEVLPASNELVVTTAKGVQYRVSDPAVVAQVMKAAQDARLTDYSNKVTIATGQQGGESFQLLVQGEDGKAPLRLQGPVDVSAWTSAKLQGSVGPIVQALDAAGAKVEQDEVVASADAAKKDGKSGGFLGINDLLDTFKTEAKKIEQLGADAFRYLKNDFNAKDVLAKIKNDLKPGDALAKAKSFAGGLLSKVGDFVKSAWDSFRNRNAADKADVARSDAKAPDATDARGFTRGPGMADALSGRVQAEVDRSDGKAADEAK